MTSPTWAELASEPTFVLTGDQDWAPDWTLELMISLAGEHDVPLHLFVTNEAAPLRAPGVSLGIHPNFLPGSSHGSDPAAVIEHCQDLVPGATTARTHAFTESTHWLAELARAGVTVDSNLCVLLQPDLVPLLHVTGLLRLPVFLEDDVVLRWSPHVPAITDIEPWLFKPGLKILNFHPALVGINAHSAEHYESARTDLFGGSAAGRFDHAERGICDLLGELIEAVHQRGLRFVSFPAVAQRALELRQAAYAGGMLGWQPGLSW